MSDFMIESVMRHFDYHLINDPIKQQQVDRVTLLLSKVTYKSGWKIYLDNIHTELSHHSIAIAIYMTVPDTNNPSNNIPVGKYFRFPVEYIATLSDEAFFRFLIADAIKGLENHEFMEQFKVGGIQVFEEELKRDHEGR